MEAKKSEKANLENKRIVFMQIGLIIALSLALVAFEWTSESIEISMIPQTSIDDFEDEIAIITKREEKRVQPEPPNPDEFIVMDDDLELDEELEIPDLEVTKTTAINLFDIPFETPEEDTEPEFFIIVEEMPTFKGESYQHFRAYISKNLTFPEKAKEYLLSGTVYVRFVVNENGNIEDANIIQGVDPLLDKAVLDAVNSSPKWEPGHQRFIPVKVRFTFPVTFILH